MELPLEVVRFNFQTELEHAKRRAQVFEFGLEGNVDALTLRAEFIAADEEKYILVGTFDDYRLKPPVLDFEEPGTGLVGTARAYPRQRPGDSFFHSAGFICAPFSRKAYDNIHKDWVMSEWARSTSNGTNWSQYSTIAQMLVLVHSKLSNPDFYGGGRMG